MSPPSAAAGKNRILILSSHSRPSLSSPVNHQRYARRHGYGDLFDGAPYPVVSPYDQKLWAIVSNMERSTADRLCWIDEDAYFMNHEIALDRFIPDGDVDFAICNSPVNRAGEWTVINGGVFFVRNSGASLTILRQALETPNATAPSWLRPKEHGLFIDGGDQERLLYAFVTNGLVGNRVQIRDFLDFNARTYHFSQPHDEHFVCHLAGHLDRSIPINAMRARYGLDPYLVKGA